MKRYTLLATMVLVGANAMAQNSYDAYSNASSDLNGTARYVGMGGALSALGGDISVMGTNPAGTGMFRKSDATFTLSGVFGDEGVLGHDGTRMSIDNAGVVIALPVEEGSLNYVNFGINYSKSKNHLFNLNTGIDNLDGIFSQTYQVAGMVNSCIDAFGWNGIDSWGSFPYQSMSLINDKDKDVDGNYNANQLVLNDNKFPGYYTGLGADNASYQKSQWGHTSQTDANLSFNLLDKYFIGFSLGFYNIDKHTESYYYENSVDGSAYDIYNYYDTRGDGFDVKLGFICRPIDDSNFRFGIAVHTPTWYKMEDVCGSNIMLYSNNGLDYSSSEYLDPWDYNYRTPWKFGFSLGHTIGDYLALGAEYEYTDLSTAKYTQYSDFVGDYFYEQNEYIKANLKGQSTIKVGMEVKPSPSFSVRAGYNLVTSPFKDKAYNLLSYLDNFTNTEYTNWKDTHRFTVGLGYRYKGGYIDLAYQYQTQKGDLYAFDDVDLKATEINNDRSQLMCTFGFRF